jgi:DNA invertase Pin-like site-specific DNA recombinase
MIPKIQSTHLQKPAYVYIRQSTMAQVRHHQESTERQYALREKAIALGWPTERIRILDRDLGISGAQANGREDFQNLVADVSMRKVGAVFSLEASRLSRSSADWHRLLELCAFTGTVIIDEDGIYNPADFNDQLLLGLKGTMSQAELHFLRARLQGGKRNKAQKGELRAPLPVGFVHDEEGSIVFDPDSQVQHAVRFLFDSFRQMGSAYGVVHSFSEAGLQFPKRAYGGAWNGRLIWGRLTGARVLGVLKNPVYAGAYVHGRYQSVKEITPEGFLCSKVKEMPISDWTVLIRGHHEGFISWEEFEQNQQLIERNRTNGEDMLLGGAAREGLALLQGLLLCAHCGRRITVRYKGNNGIYPTYECSWRRREALSSHACLHFRCDVADKPIIQRVFELIRPKQIEIAIKAMEELQRRQNSIDTQWRMKIERAEYEAHLAQRRYEEVDPANRLVAATLERRWNEALTRLEQINEAFSQYQCRKGIVVTEEQKTELRTLARDLPRLWKASTTKAKDRKRILRLLIKDITVEKLPTPKRIVLHVRWQGGAVEDISVVLPPSRADQIRYSEEIVERIRRLIKNHTDAEIANIFNQEKIQSAKGGNFTPASIRWIRYKRGICKPDLKCPGELTVAEVAKRFDVSRHVVYYWIERKIVKTRRLNATSPYWISLDSGTEEQLSEWVKNSPKITKQKTRHS